MVWCIRWENRVGHPTRGPFGPFPAPSVPAELYPPVQVADHVAKDIPNRFMHLAIVDLLEVPVPPELSPVSVCHPRPNPIHAPKRWARGHRPLTLSLSGNRTSAACRRPLTVALFCTARAVISTTFRCGRGRQSFGGCCSFVVKFGHETHPAGPSAVSAEPGVFPFKRMQGGSTVRGFTG